MKQVCIMAMYQIIQGMKQASLVAAQLLHTQTFALTNGDQSFHMSLNNGCEKSFGGP